MVMDKSGVEYDVDWYWADPAAPLIRESAFGSLNWSKPDYPTDNIGEVVGAPRPYRNGSRPAYLGPRTVYTQLGTNEQFVTGTDNPLSVPPVINWLGQRVQTNFYLKGLFPPWGYAPGPAWPTLFTNQGYGLAMTPPGDNTFNWESFGRNPAITVHWHNDITSPFYGCFPGIGVLLVSTGVLGATLRCTSYNPTLGRSTWTDPSGTILFFGETLTLVAAQGPAYP